MFGSNSPKLASLKAFTIAMYKTRSRTLQRWILQENPVREARRKEKEDNFNRLSVGKIYECKVFEILNFGVKVYIEGLIGFAHISELSNEWIKHPSEILKMNQIVKLKIISKDIDEKGRFSIKLSQKFNGSTSIAKK